MPVDTQIVETYRRWSRGIVISNMTPQGIIPTTLPLAYDFETNQAIVEGVKQEFPQAKVSVFGSYMMLEFQ